MEEALSEEDQVNRRGIFGVRMIVLLVPARDSRPGGLRSCILLRLFHSLLAIDWFCLDGFFLGSLVGN